MPVTEQTWPGLAGMEVRPMTEEESKVYISMYLAPDEKGEELHPELVQKIFCYAVLYKRLEVFGIADKVKKQLMFFLAILCDSPGKAVMWAYTLAYMYAKGGRVLDMTEFAYTFPMGVPTEESYRMAWEAQKSHATGGEAPMGNWIDDFKNWPRR